MEENMPTALQSKDLISGDILLYCPRIPNPLQRMIQCKTEGLYTHAAIYVGNNEIADSNFPFGVKRRPFAQSTKGVKHIAVLRTQYGFLDGRQKKLNDFVNSCLKRRRFYAAIKALLWKSASQKYFENQLDILMSNYGEFSTATQFSRQRFFCSAFVVACYASVGVISNNAQCAYPTECFSPTDLYKDPTFGWFFGFILGEKSDGVNLVQDPAFKSSNTRWSDFDGDENCQEMKWWLGST